MSGTWYVGRRQTPSGTLQGAVDVRYAGFHQVDRLDDSQGLAVDIYAATRGFPKAETYGLAAQMRGAAISVSSNIAEGCGRDGPAEFGRFLQIAIGSICELLSQLEVSHRLGLLQDPVSTALEDRADMVRRKLINLLGGGNSPRNEVIPSAG